MWMVCLRGAIDLVSELSWVVLDFENRWKVMVMISGCGSFGWGRLECICMV
jgi:hypothetical protein